MQTEPTTILEYQSPALYRWRPRTTFALVMSYFVLFGVILGAQGVLWPDVLRALRVSKGAFGSAQLVSPVVAIAFLMLGGFWSETLGLRRLVLASLVFLALSSFFLAGSTLMGFFIVGLLIGGMGNGLLETSANAATLDWERATGIGRMNLSHAGFSAGAIAGAAISGAALSHGWRFEQIFFSLILPCAIVFVATLLIRLPPAAVHEHDAHPLSTLRLITGRRDLRLLALLGIFGIVGESVAFVWSVIYLEQLGAPAMISGISFALFNAAMLCGRLVNSTIVARRGFRFSLTISGATLILAAILLVATRSVTLVTIGLILTGLGVAGVVPTVLSRASQLAPNKSGAVSGGIMAAAYIGFIICPPAIGWVAQATSLRTALGFLGISGIAMLIITSRVDR